MPSYPENVLKIIKTEFNLFIYSCLNTNFSSLELLYNKRNYAHTQRNPVTVHKVIWTNANENTKGYGKIL